MSDNRRWIFRIGILVMGMVALVVLTITVYQFALLRVKFTEQTEIFRLEKARKKDDAEDNESNINIESPSPG